MIPRRVVSLACSNTEIVCALGCADLLVGVDDHSDYPVEVVERLPRVGPDLHVDVEKVAALAPDLVLATLTVPGHEKVVARLEEAGLPFIAPEPVSVADVYRDVHDIAARLGVQERGETLVEAMRRELGDGRGGGGGARSDGGPERAGGEGGGSVSKSGGGSSESRRAAADPRPTVLVQWWPKPVISPGRRSWVHQVLERAGARNPLGAEDVKSRPLEDAEVARIAPDAIVLSWCGVDPAKYRPDVVYGNPAFADVPAVREGRVLCVPEAYLGRPGPRLVDGVRALREVVARCQQGAGG